jgi:ArsR family transcriptional regulator
MAVNPIAIIARALADETRLRALAALRGRELCVCQLIALFRLAPSTVSRHLAVLGQAGLVQRRKRGRWAYFRLAGANAPRPVKTALRWALLHLKDEQTVRADAQRLAGILRCDPEVLCQRTHQR